MRRYLPTVAELIDRMSICQLKAVYAPEHKKQYEQEIKDIMNDLDLIIKEKKIVLNSQTIRGILVLMLSNHFIWTNEDKAREAKGQDLEVLRLTHSINGVRNNAKNVISQEIGERKELKLDCMAAELIKQHGFDWNIFK